MPSETVYLNSSSVNQSASYFTTNFNQAVKADEVCLVSLNVWNSNPNIIAGQNNSLSYYNGTTNKTINLPQGLYQATDIYSEIANQVTLNGDTASNIVFNVNNPYQTSQVTLANGYTVNFNVPNSIGYIIGFANIQITAAGTTIGTQIANITNSVTQYLVHCSAVLAGGKLIVLFVVPL